MDETDELIEQLRLLILARRRWLFDGNEKRVAQVRLLLDRTKEALGLAVMEMLEATVVGRGKGLGQETLDEIGRQFDEAGF